MIVGQARWAIFGLISFENLLLPSAAMFCVLTGQTMPLTSSTCSIGIGRVALPLQETINCHTEWPVEGHLPWLHGIGGSLLCC